jgi:hypothetical protein
MSMSTMLMTMTIMMLLLQYLSHPSLLDCIAFVEYEIVWKAALPTVLTAAAVSYQCRPHYYLLLGIREMILLTALIMSFVWALA